MGCVLWSQNKTTRSIRHIQLRENHVRENVQNKTIQIKHTAGNTNIADIFTKEDKDKPLFLQIRNHIVKPCPQTTLPTTNRVSFSENTNYKQFSAFRTSALIS